jgi:hypothetical protein
MIICKQAKTIEETLLISNIIENNDFLVFSIIDSKDKELPFAIFARPSNKCVGASFSIRCIETMIRQMPVEVMSEKTKKSSWNNCIEVQCDG